MAMRRLLMVAFHYPPASGTSGVQRALRFSAHLGKSNWQPIVLTANPRAYPHRSNDLVTVIPDDAIVMRAQAWDALRHFSVGGKYPTALALPDRWISWFIDATRIGRAAIRRYKPDVIWSTYPIATAHKIAVSLAAWSELPLVADFRDPMAQDGYPEDNRVWDSFRRVEEMVFAQAQAAVFTTPSAAKMYGDRYPESLASIHVVENGFEEQVFSELPSDINSLADGRTTILHSGVVYPSERDPTALFVGLARLKAEHEIDGTKLCIRFRAPVHDDLLQRMSARYGVDDMIEIVPPISYSEAISEMTRADALLILQAPNCNAQVPAKLYEYFRAGRPIIAATDRKGDTALTLMSAGVQEIAGFRDNETIGRLLLKVAEGKVDGLMPAAGAVRMASREARTRELAQVLDEVITR